MRKIVLIVFILNSILSAKINAQGGIDAEMQKVLDSISSTIKPHSYTFLQVRTGFLGGFQYLEKDSVNISFGIPLEVNIRHFPKNITSYYGDIELSANMLVLNQNILTSTLGVKLGAGMLLERYNYDVQFHLGYFNFRKRHNRPELDRYTHMFVMGYNFQGGSIPVTIDYFTPTGHLFKENSSLLMIGIKIPLLDVDYQKIKEEREKRESARKKRW